MSRPNPLANPDYAQTVAEMLAAGATRQQVCDELGVKDRDTITRWKRDPRVKTRVEKISRDRVIEVTRKVDSVIAARLENAEDIPTKELLEIRKEFLGGALRQTTEKADDATVAEASDLLEKDPNFAEKLAALMANSGESDPSIDVRPGEPADTEI